LEVWDQLLDIQEGLLEQERKNTCELKRLLKLEKEKNEELVQGKETIYNLKSSSGALQDSYDVVPKLAPQQQMKPTHHKKEERANIDEKIGYARSVFLNVRRPHLKMTLVTKVVTSTI
jgi:hypothetical protein